MGDRKECYRFENHVYDDSWCSLHTILEMGAWLTLSAIFVTNCYWQDMLTYNVLGQFDNFFKLLERIKDAAKMTETCVT